MSYHFKDQCSVQYKKFLDENQDVILLLIAGVEHSATIGLKKDGWAKD